MSYFLVPRGVMTAFIAENAVLVAGLSGPDAWACRAVLLDALLPIAAWSQRDVDLKWPAIRKLSQTKKYAGCSLFFVGAKIEQRVTKRVERRTAIGNLLSVRIRIRFGWAEVPAARTLRLTKFENQPATP